MNLNCIRFTVGSTDEDGEESLYEDDQMNWHNDPRSFNSESDLPRRKRLWAIDSHEIVFTLG